jgi:hypothetical protein
VVFEGSLDFFGQVLDGVALCCLLTVGARRNLTVLPNLIRQVLIANALMADAFASRVVAIVFLGQLDSLYVEGEFGFGTVRSRRPGHGTCTRVKVAEARRRQRLNVPRYKQSLIYEHDTHARVGHPNRLRLEASQSATWWLHDPEGRCPQFIIFGLTH